MLSSGYIKRHLSVIVAQSVFEALQSHELIIYDISLQSSFGLRVVSFLNSFYFRDYLKVQG